jgi:hypothetical protein
MEKEIEYEVHYDVVATIKYIGTNNPDKDHYFEISRHWNDLQWLDDELDHATVTINDDGRIDVEPADGYVRNEEEAAIKNMMREILK